MIRALLALVLLIAPAHADTVIELPKTTARLELPDGWTKREHPALVATYKHADGSLLVVSRTDAPNGDAWSDDAKKRQAHADAIERGLQKAVPGYKRLQRTLRKASDVPVLDVVAARDGGSFLVGRVLLFRTYSLALGIEVPSKSLIPAARTITATFAPPKTAAK